MTLRYAFKSFCVHIVFGQRRLECDRGLFCTKALVDAHRRGVNGVRLGKRTIKARGGEADREH